MSTKKRKQARELLTRAELEARHGRVLNTRELAKEFVVLAIIDDQVVVRRKSDATVGKMTFTNSPRYYHSQLLLLGPKREPQLDRFGRDEPQAFQALPVGCLNPEPGVFGFKSPAA
ncbi:MAG TPA: hypothetical protein VH092_03110 [Urbifossiella sp.]|jgi:hypothetical protein|nr:hypothetical protein [Urbifossiella sp.]